MNRGELVLQLNFIRCIVMLESDVGRYNNINFLGLGIALFFKVLLNSG